MRTPSRPSLCRGIKIRPSQVWLTCSIFNFLRHLNSEIEAVETDITSIQADITDKLDKGAVTFDGVGKVAFAQNSTATSIRMYTTDINYLYVEFLTATKNIKFGFYDGATWTDYWIM